MDEAIEVIIGEFSTWEGCELHSIAYSSDEFCNDSNIAWMNELEEAEKMILKIGPCRERSLALTKLDEALMWANVAIAEAGVADYA